MLLIPQLIEDLRKQLEHLQLYKLEAEAKRGRSPSAGLQEYQTRTREAELEQEIKRLKQVAHPSWVSFYLWHGRKPSLRWYCFGQVDCSWITCVIKDNAGLRCIWHMTSDFACVGQPQPEGAEWRVERPDHQPEHPGSQESDVCLLLWLPGSWDQLCVPRRGQLRDAIINPPLV